MNTKQIREKCNLGQCNKLEQEYVDLVDELKELKKELKQTAEKWFFDKMNKTLSRKVLELKAQILIIEDELKDKAMDINVAILKYNEGCVGCY